MRINRNRKTNYKKKAGPIKRRKIIRKRRVQRVQRRVIRNQGFGFPATKVIPMRYCETVTLSAAAGTMAKYVFRANSIYDPNYTGTGHQPSGHDQWSAFYGRYTVIGAKMRAYNTDSAVSQAYPFVYGIQLNTDLATVASQYDVIIEQGRDKFSFHNSNYDRKRGVMKGYSPKRFFNLTNIKDNMLTHGSHFGANPTEEALFTLWAQDQAKSNAVGNNFVVIIDYMVLLSEPLNLPQS